MNVGCRVILVKDKLDCGIGLIEGKNAVLCLFQGHNFVALDDLKKLQVQLPVGSEIRVMHNMYFLLRFGLANAINGY